MTAVAPCHGTYAARLRRAVPALTDSRLRRPLTAETASCAYCQAVRRLVHVWYVAAGS